MTREEAINILEEIHDTLHTDRYKEFEENDVPALKMAISALREQESLAEKQATSDKASDEKVYE